MRRSAVGSRATDASGWALRASTRYAARTTSGSASGWIWRIRYGSRRSIGLGSRRLGERALDDLAQHGQRQRALAKDGVVESANVEPITLAGARFGPQPQQLELADLVGEGLARVG